ncbi:MAG: hypothetical protein SGJ13_16655 [Actinomycetota bacterium]|nr:hypothetical protein [Actinomycetota bacterium]
MGLIRRLATIGFGVAGLTLAAAGSVLALQGEPSPPVATEPFVVEIVTTATAPTVNADTFFAAVKEGSARFEDVDVAIAEGYVMNERAASMPGKNKHYRLRGANPGVLDPTQPEGLVYRIDGDTAQLLGVVFVERDDANREQPGGPITQWHDHSEQSGNENAPNMMHVWTYEGADPFAHTYRESRPTT